MSSKLFEQIMKLLQESPRSIRQIHKALVNTETLKVKNPMFISGYLKAMEDLGLPIGHTESGGAIFYYLKSKGKQ